MEGDHDRLRGRRVRGQGIRRGEGERKTTKILSRWSGGYFRGRPSRPLPVGPPWTRTRRPPNCCHGPLPCPPSPFLCHAHGPFAPSPKLAYSGGPAVRDNPAPQARARP